MPRAYLARERAVRQVLLDAACLPGTRTCRSAGSPGCRVLTRHANVPFGRFSWMPRAYPAHERGVRQVLLDAACLPGTRTCRSAGSPGCRVLTWHTNVPFGRFSWMPRAYLAHERAVRQVLLDAACLPGTRTCRSAGSPRCRVLTWHTNVPFGRFSWMLALYTACEHCGLLSFTSVTLTVTEANAWSLSDVWVSCAIT